MVRVGSSPVPFFLDPFTAQAAAAIPGAGQPQALDFFALAAGLPPGAAGLFSPGGVTLDPGAMLARMMGLPMAGGDAGALPRSNYANATNAAWGVQGPQSVDGPKLEELAQALKELFQELNQAGLPLEARPGSKLAEAMADGDFSQIPPEELMALLVALALYGSNRNNPGQVAQGGNMPFAPSGSWRGGGTNSYGGGGVHTGANGNAAAPTGPAPTGTAPSASGPFASRLAQAAESTARSMGSTGWCYRGVKNALAQVGVNVTGGSAYMAAGQLAQNPRFREVSVSPSELRNLPPGAVVVWGQTAASPHGHISVALGGGREASDHIQSQITSLRGASNYRVFIPQG